MEINEGIVILVDCIVVYKVCSGDGISLVGVKLVERQILLIQRRRLVLYAITSGYFDTQNQGISEEF